MGIRRETGAKGERIARQYLQRRGYTILAVNHANIYGEIDIIAKRDDILVFVEVKTRNDSNTEAALAGITLTKRERLTNAIHLYLHQQELSDETPWRIDVIAIALHGRRPPTVDHLEDAFDW